MNTKEEVLNDIAKEIYGKTYEEDEHKGRSSQRHSKRDLWENIR